MITINNLSFYIFIIPYCFYFRLLITKQKSKTNKNRKMKVLTELTTTLHRRVSPVSSSAVDFFCRRYINKKAPTKEGRRIVMRRDQTEKHNELIEVDRNDKHRYYKWNYQPLPTQTALGEFIVDFTFIHCTIEATTHRFLRTEVSVSDFEILGII